MISKLSTEQTKVIQSLTINQNIDELVELLNIKDASTLSIEQLLLLLSIANATYRAGYPAFWCVHVSHRLTKFVSLLSFNTA